MIIYHGAISKQIQLVANETINCLVTYASYKKHEWKPWWKSLFIDSGAFSVHNSGKTIDVGQYADYLLEWESMKKPIAYASLDVIGDPDGGMRNYKYLLKKGLNPIPTYHYGEDIIWLEKYSKMTTYIGLGATVGLSTPQRRLFFDQIFTKYPDVKKMGFHGFGITAPPLIRAYPWKSIDSTMAMRWAMYGQMLTPWGRYTAMNSIARKNHITEKLGKLNSETMRKWMESFGITWDLMLSSTTEGQMAKQLINIKALEQVRLECPSTFSHRGANTFSLLD